MKGAPVGYREHAPGPAMRPFVACYWTSFGSGLDAREPSLVLPDGSLDVIIDLRSPSARSYGPREPLYVMGAMTRPLVLPPAPLEAFIGVRFRPGMAAPFLGAPAAALTDATAELTSLWSEGAAKLGDRVLGASSLESALSIFESALRERLALSKLVPDPAVATALALVTRRGGQVRIGELESLTGWTRQHLARRFASHVGLTPKLFCRIARFRAVLAQLRNGRQVDWAEVALARGYCDQSHLIGEFRELAGLTPAEYLRRR